MNGAPRHTAEARTLQSPTEVEIGGMMKVLAKLKLFLYAWLRQAPDEMDRRQDRNEIQPLFPPKK